MLIIPRLASDDRLLESLRKTLRNKWMKPRPGKAPWAVFKFNYRAPGKPTHCTHYATTDALLISDALHSAGIMNPEHAVPIVLHDGSNPVSVPAIKTADSEDTLFIGNFEEAQDHDGHASPRGRRFFTPENEFVAINQDGSASSSQPRLPGPVADMLGPGSPTSQATTPATGPVKRKRAAPGAATGAADTQLHKQMKKRKNNIDTLKAELARLEGLRDEAKLKRLQEQRRTEEAAVGVDSYVK